VSSGGPWRTDRPECSCLEVKPQGMRGRLLTGAYP
jgi:hypothetical protein